MKLGNRHTNRCRSLQCLVALLVLLVLTALPLVESLADVCGDHCDHDSDNCGDCRSCLPTLFMMPAMRLGQSVTYSALSWPTETTSIQPEAAPPAGIDHPPQN